MRHASSMRDRAALTPVLCLLMANACVMGGQISPPERASAVITEEEVRGSSATNAYDLVAQVRPSWLRGRGASNLRGTVVLPVVYIANI